MGEEKKPAAKRIVIPYRELHPALKSQVNYLLEARRERLADPEELIGGSIFSAFAGGAVGWMGSFLTTGMWPMAAGAAVGSAVLPIAMYKDHSKIVRGNTVAVVRELKQLTHFGAHGQYHIATLKETHPFGFINRKGDLVLEPNTRFQRALKKAQETFLRHIVPGRFRFRLSNKETPKPPQEPPARRTKWTPSLVRGGKAA